MCASVVLSSVMVGGDVRVTPFCVMQTGTFTPEEAAEIVLIIMLHSYINFDLCMLLATSWFIHK